MTDALPDAQPKALKHWCSQSTEDKNIWH